MVAAPGEYRWSSYHANAHGKSDKNIAKHGEYLRLGQSWEERQAAYRELFRYHLADEDVHAIREALNQELVVGNDYFKDKIEQTLKRRARRKQAGRPSGNEVREQSWVY